MRDKREIEDMMDKAGCIAAEGKTQVPGMSYEEGVENALRWATGGTDDEPVEDMD